MSRALLIFVLIIVVVSGVYMSDTKTVKNATEIEATQAINTPAITEIEAKKAGIPLAALQYLPALAVEANRMWPASPPETNSYLAGLIDHESGCPGLKKMCWNPSAQLKTKREEGAGMGQVTKAYREDGTLRFDKLTELRDSHPALSGLDWATIYQRPDLQLRAMAYMIRTGDKKFATIPANTRFDFIDAGYNGGDGGTQSERRHCGLTDGCNPDKWFGHVENHCLKSRKALYGNRSACDINRYHVKDVRLQRQPKYRNLGV